MWKLFLRNSRTFDSECVCAHAFPRHVSPAQNENCVVALRLTSPNNLTPRIKPLYHDTSCLLNKVKNSSAITKKLGHFRGTVPTYEILRKISFVYSTRFVTQIFAALGWPQTNCAVALKICDLYYWTHRAPES